MNKIEAEMTSNPTPPGSCFCALCCKLYKKKDEHEHMQSMLHHRELEKVKGRDCYHLCQACKISIKGLNDFANHISTSNHKARMKMMCRMNTKALPLSSYLDEPQRLEIFARNKEQRRIDKKAKNKKRKISLQMQKRLEKEAVVLTKKDKEVKWAKQKTPSQEKKVTPSEKEPLPLPIRKKTTLKQYNKQKEDIKKKIKKEAKDAKKKAQNKDNRLAGTLGPLHPSQTLLNAWKPPENTWHPTCTEDFTNDDLPSSGAIIFNISPDTGLPGTSAPGPPSRLQDNISGPSQDDNTSPGRNMDVPAMLRQVRRALGVREPCRGSPATPIQGHSRSAEVNDEAPGSRIHSGGTTYLLTPNAPFGGTKESKKKQYLRKILSKSASCLSSTTSFVQSPQVSTSNSKVPKGGKRLSPLAGNRAPLRTRKDKAEENTPPSKASGRETEPPGESAVPRLCALALPTSLSRHVGKAVAQEPNLNAARRIRNVGETRKGKGEGEKEAAGLKPTLKKLLSSAGSQRKVNWTEMYQEANRKKQEKIKGMPRFGIEMVNPRCEPDGLTLDEDEEIPLAEGFQWEAVCPDGPLTPPAQPSLPSVPQSTPADDVARQQPSPALRTSKPSAPITVKTEAVADHSGHAGVVNNTCGEQSNINVKRKGKKRKLDSELTDPSSLNHSVKKPKVQKSKTDQVQVDALLAVSLREEELNSSMQSVDSSLIQARNALQSAYSEVQRLLGVKQQVTTEINNLRAKRIEILQGMQGGYSGASSMEEDRAEPGLAAATVSSTQHPQILALSIPRVASPILAPTAPSPAAPNLVTALPSLTPTHLTTSMITLNTLQPASSSSPSLSIKQELVSSHSQDPLGNRHPLVQAAMPVTHNIAPQMPNATVFHPLPQCSSFTPVPLPTPPPMSSTLSLPAGASHNQQRAENSSSGEPLPPFKTKREYKEKMRTLKQENEESTCSESEESVEGKPGQGAPVSVNERIEVVDSDSSVESDDSTSGSDLEIVAIDDSDVEDDVGAPVPVGHTPVPFGHTPSQSLTEVCAGVASSSTQTIIRTEDQKNIKLKTEYCNRSVSSCIVGHTPVPVGHTPVPIGHTPSQSLTEVCAGVASSSTQTIIRTEDQKNIKLKTEYCNRPTSSKDQLPSVPVKKQKISSPRSADVVENEEEEPSLGSFEGHTSLVHDLQIHGGLLYTCSGNMAQAYSLVTRECQAVFEGHSNKVNCLLVSSLPGLPARLYTGSSDQTVRCYSIKSNKCLEQISLPDRVLCLHICWKILFVGLANGSVVSIDLKTQRQLDTLECHGPRGVSCLDTSQEGARRILLVGSYDSSISVRDARNGLLLRTLEGHTKTVLCMKVVNDLVFSGSSDRSVHAHNIHTGELLHIYKGHSHAVTALAILGNVMITACLDKLVRVYELHSHDRLQVYGGHNDMVMCMAIHKSVIYTGCYDGSVQAVRLNLMCNHRCWWHGCTLIFGVTEHLLKHLLNDHVNSGLQTFMCRWRGCSSYFATQDSCKLELPQHMLNHVVKDSLQET